MVKWPAANGKSGLAYDQTRANGPVLDGINRSLRVISLYPAMSTWDDNMLSAMKVILYDIALETYDPFYDQPFRT